MSRNKYAGFCLMVLLILSACQRQETVCKPDEGTTSRLQLTELIDLPPPAAPAQPIQVLIRGRKTEVDKVVDYPLCNDNWSGTVYVSCDVQVAEAELDTDSNPLFLKGCNLNIAPNTVVYVAAHNDAAYYKGCSCHTGTDPAP